MRQEKNRRQIKKDKRGWQYTLREVQLEHNWETNAESLINDWFFLRKFGHRVDCDLRPGFKENASVAQVFFISGVMPILIIIFPKENVFTVRKAVYSSNVKKS